MELDLKLIDNTLESLLFVSGDGLPVNSICEYLGLQPSEVKNAVKRLQKKYGGKCGIHLLTYNGKVQFASNPDYSDIIASVLNPIKEKALSTPAMETLSIIAYRQPVTRLEVESIRGVNSDYALQALLKNNLIEIVGRKDTLGKPLLFGTTETFLKRFGIEDITQLPDKEALEEKIRDIEESTEPDAEQLYNYANAEASEVGGETDDTPEFLRGEEVVSIDGEQ